MKRFLRISGYVFAALVLVVFGYITWFYYSWNFSYPEEMKHRLATAQDVESAVRPYGVVLKLSGAEWIAIAYRDIHAPSVMSRSIALTSTGKWLESHTHFCAGLVGYGVQRDYSRRSGVRDDIALAKAVAGRGCGDSLFKAEMSPSIEVALSHLKDIGFVETSGPAILKR